MRKSSFTNSSSYFIQKYISLINIYEQQIELLNKYRPPFFLRNNIKEIKLLKKEYEQNIMKLYLNIEKELENIDNSDK